jgi:hypothetical protein
VGKYIFGPSILTALLFVGANANVRAQATNVLAPPTLNDLFAIRLQTDKQRYALGEPIKVRISIHNNTANSYSVRLVPPWGVCKLSIMSDKEVIRQTKPTYGYRIETIAVADYLPGSTHVAKFGDPNDPQKSAEWASLVRWGYDLTKSGTYTIIAIPEIRGFVTEGPQKGEYFRSSENDISNAVVIEIGK